MHLEVSDFGVYLVNLDGRMQNTTLLRCSSCQKLVTVDGHEMLEESVLARGSVSNAKMRTMTTLLNVGVYQQLEDLLAKEESTKEPGKVMSEIIALGLKQFRLTLG
jgi:hypothetical protein